MYYNSFFKDEFEEVSEELDHAEEYAKEVFETVIKREDYCFVLKGGFKMIRVGDKVKANSNSDYEGLVGEVVGIRSGIDKETDNEGDEYYVSFERPDKDLEPKLEERFSKLYGEKKTMNDIAIDLVILDFSEIKVYNGGE